MRARVLYILLNPCVLNLDKDFSIRILESRILSCSMQNVLPFLLAIRN